MSVTICFCRMVPTWLHLLVGVFLTFQAFAADKVGDTRYPWDLRPEVCFHAYDATASYCRRDDWPHFNGTVERFLFLFESRQFAVLDRALADVVESKRYFSSGRPATSAAYWAFREALPAQSGQRSITNEWISSWKSARPDSYFVVLAETRLIYSDAWRIRGNGPASSVSRESWEIFRSKLREAEQVLKNAPRDLKDTPLWHNLMLAVLLDLPEPRDTAAKVFLQAVTRWPEYYDYYDLILTRLIPSWGGSWDQVEQFIDYWTNKQFSHEGFSLYARLYINLGAQGVTPDQTRFDWRKMQRSFTDLTRRYPDPIFKNLHASYACMARDRRAFGAAMRALPEGARLPESWLPGHSLDACLRWGGI